MILFFLNNIFSVYLIKLNVFFYYVIIKNQTYYNRNMIIIDGKNFQIQQNIITTLYKYIPKYITSIECNFIENRKWL